MHILHFDFSVETMERKVTFTKNARLFVLGYKVDLRNIKGFITIHSGNYKA